MTCETEQWISFDNSTKYSISYTPTRAGEYEMTATVNGQDLTPRVFEVLRGANNCRIRGLNNWQ